MRSIPDRTVAGAGAALAGCTAAQNAQVQAQVSGLNTNLTQIGTFSVADLNAAEADAVANKDTLAIPCYPALVTFVQSVQPVGAPNLTVAGAFLLHQKARDMANSVQANSGASLIPPALKLACAAMVQDDATFVAALAALRGGAAGLGPIAPGIVAVLPGTNQRARHGQANGFTLIEMIVVLVILGLMLGLVVARGPLHSQRLDIEAAARGLTGALRVARGQAMAQHRPVVVTVAANAYRVDGAPSHAVPTDVALSGDAAIRFAPDGSSSGGHIAVQGGTARVDIAVDWLTGRVRLTSEP